MFRKRPPQPVHVAGTRRGEEMVRKEGREPGRQEAGERGYRTARDSTSVNPMDPIDPRSPCLPPA